MANLVRFTSAQAELDTFRVFDDFWMDQTDLTFVDTITDSGSVAIGDAANGIATLLASDGSVADNDEVYYATANELFLVAAGRSLYFETYLQFTEANTDDANVAAGFMSAVAANAIVDNGAGLRTSGNWFSIYKVDGGTVWICGCRNSSTVYTNTTSITAGGSSYQKLGIEIVDWDGTNVLVTYRVDGVLCRDATTNLVIEHRLPITSSTEMQAFVGAKNGDTNLETILVDYVYASQTR